MRWVHKGQRGGQNFLCLKCFQKASSQATQWSMKNMTSLFHESAVCVCKVVFITFYQGSRCHVHKMKKKQRETFFSTARILITNEKSPKVLDLVMKLGSKSRVRVPFFGFWSGSGAKKVGFSSRVSGFWVPEPITRNRVFKRTRQQHALSFKHLLKQNPENPRVITR